MKIPDIELYNMSRFRGEQMGAAMLFVILFHVGLDRWDPMFGLRRMGNVGVDIFLFLSGIGLWYSWTKMTENGMATKDMLLRFSKTAMYASILLGSSWLRYIIFLVFMVATSWHG